MNNLIIGADIGHKNSKSVSNLSDDTILFKSTAMVYDKARITDDTPYIATVNGIDYAIGSQYGNYSLDEDKSTDSIFRVCLLVSLFLSTDQSISRTHLVTGLPVNYFKKYRQHLIDSLVDQTLDITMYNTTKVFNFETVDVQPESVGALITSPECAKGSNLIIDIGGRTVDVSYFEGTKLVKTGSYDLGMLTLYSTISDYVNRNYGLDYTVTSAEDIIKNQFIECNNKIIDFYTDRFLDEHASNIVSRVKLDFPWKTAKKKFIGGGSLTLAKFIDRNVDFDTHITESGLFVNANSYKLIGEKKYGN